MTKATTWVRRKLIMFCRGHSLRRIGLGTLCSLVASVITKSETDWQEQMLLNGCAFVISKSLVEISVQTRASFVTLRNGIRGI